jgi:hypothetical protein
MGARGLQVGQVNIGFETNFPTVATAATGLSMWFCRFPPDHSGWIPFEKATPFFQLTYADVVVGH